MQTKIAVSLSILSDPERQHSQRDCGYSNLKQHRVDEYYYYTNCNHDRSNQFDHFAYQPTSTSFFMAAAKNRQNC
ncbi:hypothetical protein [Stenomitos frigidus]|uniref:Uncharacterized protein n=1 Tax=Stenomitos frigidus ULC18 TaxID=2107698 RepID=A0A2T1DT48_9CYAN|nr:hypothetical protein [Stenomitos frigidus]PSB23650.1 hypothetical protein C7B82_30760 [Stenomitos frigidus ULC18]